MCVVSFIGDHYGQKWNEEPYKVIFNNWRFVTKEEFDKLYKEVQEMKELLRKAKIYDENNNEPDCEIDEKIAKLREIAKLVGIDLDDVLKKKSS